MDNTKQTKRSRKQLLLLSEVVEQGDAIAEAQNRSFNNMVETLIVNEHKRLFSGEALVPAVQAPEPAPVSQG